MLADLDLLLTAVFATADDLLPQKARNAMRSVTDAEVVTLAVAQAMMNIASDREFLPLPGCGFGTYSSNCPDNRAIGSVATGWPTRSSG